MTDMVIPPAALKAAALGIHCRMSIGRGHFIGGDRPTPTNEDLATAALEAALPHLRPMLELAGNLGRELGRREALKEIADGMGFESHFPDYVTVQLDLDTFGQLLAAREVATKEPK